MEEKLASRQIYEDDDALKKLDTLMRFKFTLKNLWMYLMINF